MLLKSLHSVTGRNHYYYSQLDEKKSFSQSGKKKKFRDESKVDFEMQGEI